MALTEAQHRRRSYAAAYYPDSAAAAAMADGVDTNPMSPGLHSDEAAPAPMSPGLHHSAAEVKHGGVPAPAPRPQPNLQDGGDRQGGDEFRSGGSGRGNPRQRFPFRGRGRRGRNTRGGPRGFHLPALSSKPAQDAELSQDPAALKEAAPAEVQQATLAEVQKATPATTTTLDGQYALWCDICRVSCSSLVTLEGHKNGKRHQKTKLSLEQFEAHQKLMAGVQEPMPQTALGEANIDARVSIPPLPKDVTLSEELPKEATSKEVPPEKLIVETNNRSKGVKRKKPSEPVRRAVCMLCNVMCDTIPTFKAHLGAKKHMARIKRLKGPDMEYGCVPGPIFSDQPAAGTTGAPDTIFFGLARCDMLLQQGNGYEYDGVVAEISLHQQAAESGQVKDELPGPQEKPQVECQEYQDPTTTVGGI